MIFQNLKIKKNKENIVNGKGENLNIKIKNNNDDYMEGDILDKYYVKNKKILDSNKKK